MTLHEVYTEWIVHKQRQVKNSSSSSYRLGYFKHIKPQWGDTELQDINKKTVRPWVYAMIDSGRLCTKSIKDILIVLRMILDYAADELDQDVPSVKWNIAWPTDNKEGKNILMTYKRETVQKVIDSVLQKPDSKSVALLITFCTGMRIGEICSLRWGDVDLDKKVFQVRRTVMRVYDSEMKHTKMIIGPTKTGAGTRDIPIVKNIMPVVRKFKKFYGDSCYVASGTEKLLEPRTYRDWHKRYLKKVGVKEILKFHSIRHTFASSLIDQGVDIKSVSAMMGHSDVSVTMNLYVHPSAESKSKAINKAMSNLF